jgi:membrane dipeptidase
MEDATQLPKITAALLARGYTEAQVRGILGENVLQLMERVQAAAEGAPARRP